MITQSPSARRLRPGSRPRTRTAWPLTSSGTFAVLALVAGGAMVIIALWRS